MEVLGKLLTTQNIIEGGAVVLALVLSGIIIFLIKVLMTVFTNHTIHTDEVIGKNSESNTLLASSLERHSATIDKLADTVERKL